MVLPNDTTKALIDAFPGFFQSKAWKEHIEFWEENERYNVYKLTNSLKQYFINDILLTNDIDGVIRTLNAIELLRNKYISFPEDSIEGTLDNAICTVFLESLLNWASNGEISYDSFIPYLGTLSKNYCKEWDKFTGVRSPGLWTDQDWGEANHD